MSGIDEAASAFDAAIAAESSPPTTTRSPGPAKDVTEGPPDRMFPNLGDLEIDEGSPPRGGGDDVEDAPPRKKLDEEDESEEVEEEEEASEDDEESDEEEGEDKEFLSQEVEVMVDGKAETVTLKEALEGYTRTKTFHNRMNDIEEAKKIIAGTAKDAVQNFEYSAKLAEQIEAYLTQLVPPEPNWDEEFRANPAVARQKQKYYEQVKGFREKMQGDLKAAAQRQRESHAVQLKGFAEAESRKFNEANAKNWASDPQKRQKDLQAMRRTALAQGFSEEEIGQVYDSRMLQVLLKASKYDRMMASKPKPVRRETVKQVPTGGGPARRKSNGKGLTSAMKRLHKTGHLDDAANVFTQMINQEK